MANRRLRNFDFVLSVSVIILACFGVLIIFSATHTNSSPAERSLYQKQIVWLVIGFAGLALMSAIPHKIFYLLSYIMYLAALLSLAGLFFVPASFSEAFRWYRIGPLSFQPSELAKIATIFAVARYLSTREIEKGKLGDLFVPLFLVAVPALLVLRQPDLGTALVFVAILFPMLYWSGLGVARLFFLVSPGVNVLLSFNWIAWTCFMFVLFGSLYVVKPKVSIIFAVVLVNVSVGLATPYLWNNVLHEYQRKRVIAFVNPEKDPLGMGYQVIQSKVAVGSGSFTGKGFLQGTQTKLDFLPKQHTDFIFAVVAEEFGFLGSVLILSIFGLMVYRGLRIAAQVRNSYASLVAIGVVTVFVFHIVVNIGMTLGIMPVVGLPLPFLSYGGSSLLANMCMVGLLLNIGVRRYAY
ncbi:MAG: rod shape-determining protein RodA [Gemmatimonadota bacterium]|nr:MAG: rod shape-determining protein RodA [Gemmatimonadota bacterium]